MTAKIVTGNIFTTNSQVLVNTVNCVGVMGAGIALECRLRYPQMFAKYESLCEQHKIDIGVLWIYRGEDRWILNFPTKRHWRYPSKPDYLVAGLEKFCATYADKNITSIAFPLLGADKGGIPADQSLEIMKNYLDPLPIDVEIYQYDPKAHDDLYSKVKAKILAAGVTELAAETGIRKQELEKVIAAFNRSDIRQLNQLGKVKGVGIKTLERVFSVGWKNDCNTVPRQNSLI